jgi:PAS domain S-box-containing protein
MMEDVGDSMSHFEGAYTIPEAAGRPPGRSRVLRTETYMEPGENMAKEHEKLRECLYFVHAAIDAVAHGTDVIVAARDAEFRYVFFNEAYRQEIERLTGKKVTVGMSMLDLFAHMPKELEVARNEWSQAMHGETTSKTSEFGDPARDRRLYRVDHRPVRDPKGRVIGVVEVGYDISQAGQAEEETRRLHEMVARERDRLSALLRSISDEIWFADSEGRFVLVNPSGVAEFGLHPEEVVDVKELAARLEVLRPDGTPRPVEEAPPLRALKGESVKNVEEIILSPATGEARHRQVSSSPVKNADGKIVGSVSVVRDITEMKLAEERIRNLATFPENNTNPVLEIDLSGNVTYANPATRKALKRAGLDEEDAGLFVPPGIAGVFKDLAEKEEKVYQCEIAVGDAIFEVSVALVSELGVGRIYARDVTQRKLAEQETAASRNVLQSIIDNSPRLIHVTDLEGRYLIVNRALAEMVGMTPEQMTGRTRRDVMPGSASGRYEAHDREVIEAGRPLEFEEYGTFGGRRIVFLTTKFPLFDTRGRMYAIAGMSVDISDIKETEAALKRDKETTERLVRTRTRELMETQAELQRARRLADIGALAATVAHELRNPLAAIGMAAYNIKRKAADPALDRHITNIEKKINESDQIINNLLFYSRIRPPRYETVDIRALIDEVVGATGNTNGVGVPIRTATTLPAGTRIEVDPIQTREVLQNIINNAQDAVAPGTGMIEVLCTDKDPFVEITIKDNGSGIDRTILPNVFDPFFSTKAKGTGLGLSICRQIIDFHGGSISINSRAGGGAEVMVRLPKRRGGG